jgi:peptidoglycan/xylan/chitin deacetylase (PgdA/CDA1 family)
MDDLLAYFQRGRPLPKSAALITFDDGYRECLDVAVPILRRHGVTATFFLSTSHIAKRNVFWWDRISYLLKRSQKASFRLDYPFAAQHELAGQRSRVTRALLSLVKATYALDLERFLDELAKAVDVPWSSADELRYADQLLMTWDDARALRKAGMDVQSHARTHRVLQTLSPLDLESELSGSRHELEAQLNEPVSAIAYPVGNSVRHEPLIRQALRSAGYQLGFSNSTGLGCVNASTDPLDIRRIGMDTSMSDAYFRASVTLPRLTYGR